ncbi:MAG: hypothetical protein AAF471_02765 [Myxococcota bacterium]
MHAIVKTSMLNKAQSINLFLFMSILFVFQLYNVKTSREDDLFRLGDIGEPWEKIKEWRDPSRKTQGSKSWIFFFGTSLLPPDAKKASPRGGVAGLSMDLLGIRQHSCF